MSESQSPIDSDDEKKVIRHLVYCLPLGVIATLMPTLAYHSVLIPNNEPADIWFQRSGSLMVLFAVWMEFNLLKISDEMILSGIVTGQQAALRDKYKSVYKVAQFIAVVLGVTGTFIWGYGDFFK